MKVPETDTVNNICSDQRNLLADLTKDKSSYVEGNLFEAQTSSQHARDHNFNHDSQASGITELTISQTADQTEFTRAQKHGFDDYLSSQQDHGDKDILNEVNFLNHLNKTFNCNFH